MFYKSESEDENILHNDVDDNVKQPQESAIVVGLTHDSIDSLAPIQEPSTSAELIADDKIVVEECDNSTAVATQPIEIDDELDELVRATCPNAEKLIQEIAADQEKEAAAPASKISIDYEFGDETSSSKLQSLKESLRTELLNNSRCNPQLRGSLNSVIDLDSGDILPGERAGVEDLVERFYKHAAKKKKPVQQSQQFNILGTGNGVIEMETVTLTSMDKDADIIPDCKPRSAFFKLKEALSSQLAAKRREEILRRKADEIEMDKKSKTF